MRTRIAVVLISLMALTCLSSAAGRKYGRFQPPPDRTGLEDVHAAVAPSSAARVTARRSLDDPIGTVDTVGFTWYDEQQFTTCGKQIAVDHDGYVHHVWTNGTEQTNTERHVYYNAWDPSVSQFIIPNTNNPVGVAIDAAVKAGYVNVAVNNEGYAFAAFHQLLSGQTAAHAAVGMDFLPHLGAFTVTDVPHYQDLKIIYPKIACDIAGDVHLTATQGVPANYGYYAKGTPNFDADTLDWGAGFNPEDSTFYLTRDIATSFHSSRVAMAWVYFSSAPGYGPDIYYKTSEDGGVTWGDPVNVTNYPPIDTSCVSHGGEIAICNQDTIRPHVDLSVILDQNDVVHIAFMARGFYYWLNVNGVDSVGPWLQNDGVSSIWHWDETHQEFNIIAERTDGTLNHQLGLVQALCQRPSLAVDTTTGYIYCSYQVYDTTQWSLGGYIQADAWVSVSATGGRTWSAGTDVTNTNGGQDAPAGSCLSERDINIARFVTDGIIHMQYELDLDAGTGINSNPEGSITHNPILYQRIPVDQIPLRPFINPFRVLRLDSTGYPRGLDTTLAVDERHSLKPGQFTLFQNYPNPFNPTTTIQFDLASETVVSLKVFDVLGREVATLLDKAKTSAGAHMVSFDASHLSSGVYFYRLETPSLSQTRKMVVLK